MSKRKETHKPKSRSALAQHGALHKTYERILRGIHYRHEFARRNPKVNDLSQAVISALGLDPKGVASYETPDGARLVDIISTAYRKKSRGVNSPCWKQLRDLFESCGILPISPHGSPFFGDRLRLDIRSRVPRSLQDDDKIWMKRTWNDLVAFEKFAMAEFKLTRPIMMPVLELSDVRTRSGIADLRETAERKMLTFPVFLDARQTKEVLHDYLDAVVEQARESSLIMEAGSGSKHEAFKPDENNYERYLDALDLDAEFNKYVPFEAKEAFLERHESYKKPTYNKIVQTYKDCRSGASVYRDSWFLIL